MKPIAIKAEHISKQYRLGQVGTGTLSHDLNRFWHRVRGKEDPYLRIGEVNDRTTKGGSDYVWSLKDINFEIEQGDAVGIIGRNGAGKSTLLKLLSKVTKPTTGKIYTNGRIASLLEVGTGFHPEMTGRENIFLNGAILGMTRKEIKRKFDEIVDFSGVEKYIDTPVKRYSSGMYIRLAFAVAAHLESEILIVDEVLAVGDAEFQKKCLGKMGDVSKGEGRTVLFVSHNMNAVKDLCNNSILLSKGSISKIGDTGSVIEEYINSYQSQNEKKITGNKEIEILDFKTLNYCGINELNFFMDEQIICSFSVKFNETHHNLDLGINIRSVQGDFFSHITNLDEAFEISGQKGDIKTYQIKLDKLNFHPGSYIFDIGIVNQFRLLYNIESASQIFLERSSHFQRTNPFPSFAKVFIKSEWTETKN